MNKFAESLASAGRKHALAAAAIALVSMVSGCQATDTTRTGSINGRIDQGFGNNTHHVNKIHNVGKKVLYRKALTQLTSVTRTREEAYAAFVRPPRVGSPARVKVSFSPGGPFLGHSPWICSPSGFGQRASCRSRY
ncbi:MAG: hypothetical protein E5V49_05475 [Mesorhizobium sp.]|nr:hypothetical protein EN848_21155 [bacterium M00.F.Ca.ET.205.01.1.1]TGU50779.1 hypothetical protein EN795_20700 [bacterium M00.F.Ca.ET.152.01.1.1]TGV34271.1 hypothetical protein EN829_018650 [Mesorhizobium sp. M00.F.Ca.ET.186.01.1.1]TGZ42062.1 hypothetical protein EN805_17395 [bacterium M00.F.Ca.ET.162.01.1.1]TIW60896.1 MAG: hypothetical protein E5V48_11565 [Mesorhizobium sp.]